MSEGDIFAESGIVFCNNMKIETVKNLIQKTKSDYSKIASDFSRTRTFPWQIMQEFAKFVKDGDQVLDFGCGSGRLLDALEKENLVYVGVDPVPELIDIARQKYLDLTAFDQSARGRAQKLKRSIDFRVIDINPEKFNLDFADGYFNHIFSIAVFHHLPSRKLRLDTLKEFKRILKYDGYVFLSVWNLWQMKFWTKLIKFSLMKIFGKIDLDWGDLFISYSSPDKKTIVDRYHHAYCKNEITNLIREAGFKVEKVFYDKKKFNLCVIIKKAEN